MKYILSLALILPFTANADEWTGKDKNMHFTVSAIIGMAVRQEVNNPYKAFGYAMIPGVVKEIIDGRNASAKDLVADALGAAVGVYTGGLIVKYRDGLTTVTYSRDF